MLFKEVWCDQDTDGGGWTVILKRLPVSGEQLNFKKPYSSYKKPFGEAEFEYWIGKSVLI